MYTIKYVNKVNSATLVILLYNLTLVYIKAKVVKF